MKLYRLWERNCEYFLRVFFFFFSEFWLWEKMLSSRFITYSLIERIECLHGGRILKSVVVLNRQVSIVCWGFPLCKRCQCKMQKNRVQNNFPSYLVFIIICYAVNCSQGFQRGRLWNVQFLAHCDFCMKGMHIYWCYYKKKVNKLYINLNRTVY